MMQFIFTEEEIGPERPYNILKVTQLKKKKKIADFGPGSLSVQYVSLTTNPCPEEL